MRDGRGEKTKVQLETEKGPKTNRPGNVKGV